LTHHEIVGLVEPFTRSGRRLDLAASDRLERRLRFKPVDLAGAGPSLRETLQLENTDPGSFRLTRTLALASGLQATLRATGPSPRELLAQVDAVDPQRQFLHGPGYAIACSHALEPAPGGAAGALILGGGEARLEGLRLTLNVPLARRAPADIALASAGADALELPEDLLAVLGWNWARLIPTRDGWKSRLRLRGSPLERSRRAELALHRAAGHLARALAEPPGRFHDRLAAARWGVVFRRAIPLLTAGLLIATTALLPHVEFEHGPGPWLFLFHLPTLLLVLSFYAQELSQFEIPPRPRRSTAPTWRLAPAAAAAAALRDGPALPG
jgi:hypothetical protein